MIHFAGTVKRSSLQGEEKVASQQITVKKGSNFNTLPASMAKVHLQNIADYASHTLTMRREKGGIAGVSTELPGAKSIYICDGELFKQLDGDLTRVPGDSGGPEGGGASQGYILLPNNNNTLRPTKGGKEDQSAKYNIGIEQLPQTRLIHLANAAGSDPAQGFGLKSLPTDRVSVSCMERDSSGQKVQNYSSESQMTNNTYEPGELGNSGMMSKSETVSTLSMSSLEVRRDSSSPRAQT